MMSVQDLAPLYRNSHDLPWIPFTPYSTAVKLKLLQVNPVCTFCDSMSIRPRVVAACPLRHEFRRRSVRPA
jgi:hypothetical protein